SPTGDASSDVTTDSNFLAGAGTLLSPKGDASPTEKNISGILAGGTGDADKSVRAPSRAPYDIPEVQLRIGVRGQNKADVERFTKEIAPLILTGPPAVTGFAGGRPKVEEIMAYFPALIPKSLIETKVDIVAA
ncbi:MAG: acyclic terpene utilization AtuA family protein, partial [Pyrinomonadaceae bacterium]